MSSMIDVVICPLCGEAAHSHPFDQRSFQGLPVTNRECARCGLVYQSPRMSEAALAEFYEAEYRRLYQGSAGPNPKDLSIQRARAASLLAFTRRYVPGLARHLDIGCSAGLLLEAFRAAYGCQPAGVEPGTAYREYARSQGLEVWASLDELKAAGETGFDLVSLGHVLEHLPDPVGYLAALRTGLLKPGGSLLVEVPNLFAHDSFEVAHLVSYSPHTLAQTLQKAGYEIIALDAHGRPRSEVLPLYLTVLARPAARPAAFQVTPETGVARKRRWGMLRRRLLTRLMPRRAWLPLAAGSKNQPD